MGQAHQYKLKYLHSLAGFWLQGNFSYLGYLHCLIHRTIHLSLSFVCNPGVSEAGKKLLIFIYADRYLVNLKPTY